MGHQHRLGRHAKEGEKCGPPKGGSEVCRCSILSSWIKLELLLLEEDSSDGEAQQPD